MGCCSNRDKTEAKSLYATEKTEDLQVASAESKLGYSKAQATKVKELYSKHLQAGSISATDLNLILSQLGASKYEVSKTAVKPETKFYDQFNTGTKFSVKGLQITGVLLASGTPMVKAQVLFAIFDANNSNSLSSTEADSMLKDLFEASLKTITISNTQANSIVMGAYTQKLSGAIPKASEALKKKLILTGTELVKEGFVNAISHDEELAKLVTMRGLRNLLLGYAN
jgi:hypothetical protein